MKINLKRGDDQLPKTYKIGPNSVSNRAIQATTENMDVDIHATFSWGEDDNSAESVPLVDGAGNPVSMIITAAAKKAGIMLKDIFAKFLFITFNTPQGVTKAVSSLEQSGDITQLAGGVEAMIDPNGSDTTVTFEWGLTDQYELAPRTIEVDIPGDSAQPVKVLTVFHGLTPDTTYYWRVKMVNAAGTSFSQGKTFDTLAIVAPTLSDEDAVPAVDSAAISANVNPNGDDSTVVIQFGLDNTYGGGANLPDIDAGTEVQAVQVVMEDLAPNTTYHYRFVVTNSAGVTEGQDKTFQTLAA